MKLQSETRPQVVVIGGAHIEFILNAPDPGAYQTTVMSERADVRPGGRAACIAAALARLRSRVCLISCLGTDPFAGHILSELSTHNINLDFIQRSAPHFTGLVHNILFPNGMMRRFVTPGSSSQLTPEAVRKASVMISAADIVIITTDIPPETVAFAAKLAHRYNRPALLDPDPPVLPDAGDLSDFDIIAADSGSAAALCGWDMRSPGDAARAAARFVTQGAGAAIIDLGRRGAVCALSDKNHTYTPAKDVELPVRHNTRAAFNAGLAWALALGYSLPQASWVALSCAALVKPYAPEINAFQVFPAIDDLVDLHTLEIR